MRTRNFGCSLSDLLFVLVIGLTAGFLCCAILTGCGERFSSNEAIARSESDSAALSEAHMGEHQTPLDGTPHPIRTEAGTPDPLEATPNLHDSGQPTPEPSSIIDAGRVSDSESTDSGRQSKPEAAPLTCPDDSTHCGGKGWNGAVCPGVACCHAINNVSLCWCCL